MGNLSSKDKTIHDEFSRCGKNAKEWMNKCVLLLPKIEKNEIWRKKGFANIYGYARKIAGMSRNKVNESLRILKKTENLPAIRAMIEKRGIFVVKPVVNVATRQTDQLWAKKASEMNQRTLETFVRDYKREQQEKLQYAHSLGRLEAVSPTNNRLFEPNNCEEKLSARAENEKIQVSMKLDSKIFYALKKIKGEGDWNQAIKKLLKYSQKELENEQKCVEENEKQLLKELKEEKPQPVRSNNHTVTIAIKKYIKKRSKGICEHPNCNKPGKHIHHIKPFALKREHDPDKLIYLCEEHHQIIHLGYIDDGNIVPEMKIESVVPMINLWHQIEKLPNYDIKNIINKRITEFKYNH